MNAGGGKGAGKVVTDKEGEVSTGRGGRSVNICQLQGGAWWELKGIDVLNMFGGEKCLCKLSTLSSSGRCFVCNCWYSDKS